MEETKIADKMALQALFTEVTEIVLHNEHKIISDEDIRNLVLDSDGDVKQEYFDSYREHYEFYFKQLTDKNNYESKSN